VCPSRKLPFEDPRSLLAGERPSLALSVHFWVFYKIKEGNESLEVSVYNNMCSYTVRNIGLRVLVDEGQRKMILVLYEEGDHRGF
jgi:hypothetical protein